MLPMPSGMYYQQQDQADQDDLVAVTPDDCAHWATTLLINHHIMDAPTSLPASSYHLIIIIKLPN
jgi:hypothetical protein